MKPGRRRLLIPGLLVALLIVVVLAAAIRRADAETTPSPVVPHTEVSVMSDPRITESSGLAASAAHPGIAYTINDSGHAAQVFAVRISTGEVVGVTSVRGVTWRDPEAMALSDGRLWIADAGDNDRSRDDSALYVIDEPGLGDRRASAVRYPIGFGADHADIEAMSVHGGWIALYDKVWPTGAEYVVAAPLVADRPNMARPTGRVAPMFVTDGAATADGRYVLLRNNVMVEIHDVATWEVVHVDVIPPASNGESLTVEATGRSYLLGSEGKDSALIRVAFEPDSFHGPVETLDPQEQWELSRSRQTLPYFLWLHRNQVIASAVLTSSVAAAVTWWLRRRRRRAKASSAVN